MFQCNICPFNCSVDRETKFGVCRLPNKLLLSHYQLHFWEEPMISGSNGSGTIFFTGCNGRCVFCQNYEISNFDEWSKRKKYSVITEEDLLQICFRLKEMKAHNINLVTPTPYSDLFKSFLIKYKKEIKLPIVWNSNGYEKKETIKRMEGLVDIYLPDIKYYDNEIAARYSGMPNYFEFASEAIKEMFRQVGYPKIDKEGMMQKGIIIRHLVLPGQIEDSKKVLQWIFDNFGAKAEVSVMAQYYPTHKAIFFPEINRRLIKEEYQEIEDYFLSLGFEDGLIQDLDAAEQKFTPKWELNIQK